MESTIEELYYGNITPSERKYHETGEYVHILQLITHHEEKLTAELTEDQKETFRGTLTDQLQQQRTERQAQIIRDIHLSMPDKTDLHTTHHTNSFDVAKRH